MCLIVFALQQHPDYPLIVAANRDEYYQRPTAHAHYWADHPQIFAGRDLQAQGTWLGVNQQGHFAALTNIREGLVQQQYPHSRGQLCRDYLSTGQTPPKKPQLTANYAGFNLITGSSQGLHYYSNRGQPQPLSPGIYGLSNGLLDSPWPKVELAKTALASLIAQPKLQVDELIALLQSRHQATDQQLPDTGVGLAWERLLSSQFIHSPDYGTRCTTALLFHRSGKIEFAEQNHNHQGLATECICEIIRP